jgi:hypothetical protein
MRKVGSAKSATVVKSKQAREYEGRIEKADDVPLQKRGTENQNNEEMIANIVSCGSLVLIAPRLQSEAGLDGMLRDSNMQVVSCLKFELR